MSQDAATEFPVFLALCLGLESDDSCKLYGITFRFCGSRVLDLDVEFKGLGLRGRGLTRPAAKRGLRGFG